MRCTLPLLLILTSVAVHAAEQPGTLSKEATQAGPAVDTSKTNATPSSPPVTAEAKPAAQPSTTSQRAGGPQAVVRNDRLNLDTTVVTGNRELPKVLYIVPWKKSDLGDLPAQPFNTLLDEALTPVDRDVFRREVTYYGAMHGGADAPASSPPSTEK
ncbi:hypothetical protein ACFPN2_19670 [Steroidobacter flavus]|uniref:Uncharacterized protein n=1 Tax=Steroidobacter flavus TaxID=1842136 RepID=A0ABV8SWA8_9GAMM